MIAANMEVEYNYDAALGKSFRIVKQSGSKMLCERVLKRALESEMEASQDPVTIGARNFHRRADLRIGLIGRGLFTSVATEY